MHEAKNFESLIGIEGFSDQLLKNHFMLYQGYVKNTNLLADTLKTYANEEKTGAPEYAELKRRFGWEFNGMRLHELYFENMTRQKSSFNDAIPELTERINKDFGNVSIWKLDFTSTGMMRGIGWVALCADNASKNLFNVWIDEHNTGNLCCAQVLLIMDVFEHAYMPDYGLKRAEYIETFFNAIDWKVVNDRYAKI